ncbi:hypothetical protein Ntsu_53350 [Nocardia sp. IFM 10818]
MAGRRLRRSADGGEAAAPEYGSREGGCAGARIAGRAAAPEYGSREGGCAGVRMAGRRLRWGADRGRAAVALECRSRVGGCAGVWLASGGLPGGGYYARGHDFCGTGLSDSAGSDDAGGGLLCCAL